MYPEKRKRVRNLGSRGLSAQSIQTGRQYEAEIEGRGTYFHILTGQHKYGDYLCIPSHDVGCERSKLSDFFWNRERISRLMGEDDAVTVATGLMYLEALITDKASD